MTYRIRMYQSDRGEHVAWVFSDTEMCAYFGRDAQAAQAAAVIAIRKQVAEQRRHRDVPLVPHVR